MVSRIGSQKGSSKKRLKYFFLNDQLHKVLHVSRPHDQVWCWIYDDHKRVVYSWSYVKQYHKTAFTTIEVAKMVNRDRRSLATYHLSKGVRSPAKAYALNESGQHSMNFWDEERILDLHEYLLSIHNGRPNKNGYVKIKPTPTRAELIAMMRHNTVMYVKTDDGEFAPAFKEPEW